MKILYVAEIVSKPGVFALKKALPEVKEKNSVDFVVANADGVTGGFGMGKNHAHYMNKLGIDALTSGECVYYKRDIHQTLSGAPFLLRPGNFPPSAPGRGWKVFEVGEQKVVVMNLLGVSGFSRVHPGNPFQIFDLFMEKIRNITPIVVIDFHGATTAEKNTFFQYARGRVSAVIGSHTKVQTSDGRIIQTPEALDTGVITDAGRTGSFYSVGGFEPQNEIKSFRTGVNQRAKEHWEGLEFQGVIIEINPEGSCQDLTPIRIPVEGEHKND